MAEEESNKDLEDLEPSHGFVSWLHNVEMEIALTFRQKQSISLMDFTIIDPLDITPCWHSRGFYDVITPLLEMERSVQALERSVQAPSLEPERALRRLLSMKSTLLMDFYATLNALEDPDTGEWIFAEVFPHSPRMARVNSCRVLSTHVYDFR